MIKPILFGAWGDYWKAPMIWRLFYRSKALVCFLLHREPPCDVDMYDYTHVLLTYTDGGTSWAECGTTFWFEAIGVGGGVFRNWWVTYVQGSN